MHINPLSPAHTKEQIKENDEDKTIINVAILMPPPENGDGIIGFENQIYDVTDNYSIELYTLYYNKDTDEFTGFLPKVMMNEGER